MTLLVRAVGVLALLCSLVGGLLVAPANAAVGLEVSASVTGGPFLVGSQEAIPVTLTVTNSGADDRPVWGRVRNLEGSPFAVRGDTWGDLDPVGAGAVFGPGETRTYHLIGYVTSWSGQPRIMIGVIRPTPDIPEIAETELAVPLVPGDTTAPIGGRVFADANENHTADPGEEFPGITVRLGQNGSAIGETVTGADGRFAFPAVPVGFYDLQYGAAPHGWVLPEFTTVRLDGTGASADVQVRARRPISESLRASMKLDRGSYSAGDRAKLTVTLTNTGKYPLTGLYAGCDRLGTRYHLLNSPEDFGELAYGGPGATVQPGQTRVFTVPGTVPANADSFGLVSAICDFGDDELYRGAAEAAPVYVKVRSGKTADTYGWVFYDKDNDYTVDEGEAVTKTRVGLRDVITGRVVAVATTDAMGRLDYTGVPVGRYSPEIFGPWTPLPGVIQVAADPYTVPFGSLRVEPRHY